MASWEEDIWRGLGFETAGGGSGGDAAPPASFTDLLPERGRAAAKEWGLEDLLNAVPMSPKDVDINDVMLPGSRAISPVLDLLNRPRYGIVGGLMEGGEGVVKGLKGQEYSWGDPLGIPDEGLVNKGARLALDLTLDPMLGVGKLSRAAKASRWGKAAAQQIAESKIGKTIFQQLPGGMENPVNAAWEAATTEHGRRLAPMDELRAKFNEAVKAGDISPEVAGDLWEMRTGTLPENILSRLDELSKEGRNIRRARQAGEESLGFPMSGEISGERINYRPRIGTAEHPAAMEDMFGKDWNVKAPVGHDPSRELTLLADPIQYERGSIVPLVERPTGPEAMFGNDMGKPLVVKKSALTWDENTGSFKYKGQQVVPVEAGMSEVMAATPLERKHFVQDPALAITGKSAQDSNYLVLLDFGRKLREMGLLVPKGTGPANWRSPKVRNFDMFDARPDVANFLENKAGSGFDPSSTAEGVAKVLQDFRATKIGKGLQDTTGLWAKLTLTTGIPFVPWPGWIAGNIATNQVLQYEKGMSPLKILTRDAQAALLQMGKGKGPVKGIGPDDFIHEMSIRDVVSKTRAGTGMDLSTDMEKATRGPAKGVNRIERVLEPGIEKGFEVGRAVENNTRLALAIDWIKKWEKKSKVKFAELTPDAKSSVLDQAGRYAKDSAVDYNLMNPWERQLKGSGAMPFYPWTQGIARNTLKTLAEHPERLSRLSTTLNTVFDPLEPEQQSVADLSMLEQLPVKGALGMDFGTDENANQMIAMIGRFLPQGQLEQLGSRPGDQFLSMIGPYYKGPAELLANRNTFRDRPIDRMTDSFLGPITAPLKGEPFEPVQGPFGVGMPAGLDYLLQMIPASRALKSASNLSRDLGIWEDPSRSPTSSTEALGSFMSGSKFYPFNEEALRRKREQEMREKQGTITGGMRRAELTDSDYARLMWEWNRAYMDQQRQRYAGYAGE